MRALVFLVIALVFASCADRIDTPPGGKVFLIDDPENFLKTHPHAEQLRDRLIDHAPSMKHDLTQSDTIVLSLRQSETSQEGGEIGTGFLTIHLSRSLEGDTTVPLPNRIFYLYTFDSTGVLSDRFESGYSGSGGFLKMVRGDKKRAAIGLMIAETEAFDLEYYRIFWSVEETTIAPLMIVRNLYHVNSHVRDEKVTRYSSKGEIHFDTTSDEWRYDIRTEGRMPDYRVGDTMVIRPIDTSFSLAARHNPEGEPKTYDIMKMIDGATKE